MKTNKQTNIVMRIALLIMIIPLLSTCDYSYLEIEELPPYEYSSEWAIPLIKSKMTINSLFISSEDQTVEVDSDDLVWLVYEGGSAGIKGEEIITLPNQQFNYQTEFPTNIKNNTTVYQTTVFQSINDEELTKIIYNDGVMNISVESAQFVIDGGSMNIVGTILNSDDGSGTAPIRFNLNLPENPSQQIDLTGKTINFGNGQSLVVRFDIDLLSAPSNPPYNINFVQTYSDLAFDEVHGYLGQMSLNFDFEEISMKVFENVVDGDIFFQDPRFDLIANNSFGIPVSISFDEFYVSRKSDEIVNVTGNPVPNNPWNLNYSTTPGQTETTFYQINNSNSNIQDAIFMKPHKLNYDASYNFHPDGNSGANGFIKHDSEINLGVEVNLPLHGWLYFARFNDTIGFTLPANTDMIDYMELVIHTVNEMPISASLQLDAVDENLSLMKTIFRVDEPIFLSADVDDQGNVLDAKSVTTTLRVEREDLEEIRDIAYLVLSARVTSYGEGIRNIKIFSRNTMETFLSVRFGVRQTIDLGDSGDK